MSCISTLPSAVVADHLVVPLKVATFTATAVQAPADASSEPLEGAGRASNSSDDDAISSLNGSAASSSSTSPFGKSEKAAHHFISGNSAVELSSRVDQQQVTLYWTSGFGSPPCMRLMIAMAEKQLLDKAVKIHVNLLAAENRAPEIEKLNPRMQVPILKVGHVVICESMASCLFIEDEFKDSGNMLLPHNAMLKAATLQRCLEALNLETKTRDIVLPLQNWLPPELRQPVDPMRIKMAKESLANELNFWEKHLAENVTNEFLVGSNFSMADCVFFPSLAWLVKYGLELNCRGWENLKRYYDALKDRPSILASWPPTWSMKSPIGELRMFDDIVPSPVLP